MLSYSRAKGVFGGVSLFGSSLGPDDGDNEKLYGKKASGERIFSGTVPAPPSAKDLIAELKQASPTKIWPKISESNHLPVGQFACEATKLR
jgi:lipid-binding SYLF domain-containing protein